MDVRSKIMEEALEAVLLYSRASAGLPTGFGKCLLGLKYIERIGAKRILIVAPKLSIFQSWIDEAVKWEYNEILSCIDFSTYLSLDKKPNNYDLVILDEVHSLLESQRPWLTNHKGRILGLSGTMPRYHHSEKGIMLDAFAPVVYTYGVDEAVQDEILNDYRIIVHPLELSTKKDLWIQGKGKGWWSSEQLNYEYWTQRVHNARSRQEKQITSVMRSKALMTYKTKENYARVLFNACIDKCILFGNEQAQVDSICAHTYHSNNPASEENLELFKEGKILKLAAVNMLSEGVNIPGLKRAIIMHSYSPSSPRTQQKLGRILRLSPKETAILEVLVYTNTQDEVWLRGILEDFSPDKISWKESDLIKI